MRRLVNGLTLAAVALLFVMSMASAAAAQNQAQTENPQQNQTQAQTEAEGPAPSIVIEEMRHDMGNVFEAEKYKYAFKVKNVGEGELVIKNVKPG